MEGLVSDNKVCIIGAGYAGLAAAHDLGKRGYEVILLETRENLGGLARSTFIDSTPIELYYHFICAGDTQLLQLINELGLNDQLKWQKAKTSYFYQNRMYAFGLPTDLLFFHPVPFFQRIKFGLNVMRSRYRKNWHELDHQSASQWLPKEIGKKSYEVIWQPLLRFKFGNSYDRISAAWIWHRIHRVAKSRRHLWENERFGYLSEGTYTLVNAISQKLKNNPRVTIRLNSNVVEIIVENGTISGLRVEGDSEVIPCKYVISTIPLPKILKIAPQLNHEYQVRYSQIEYLGVICGLIKLKHQLTDSFWINICDTDITFNGIIEYSNLNHFWRNNDRSIIYIPHYLKTSSSRFTSTDKTLLNEYIHGLTKINHSFREDWIENCIITRDLYAQAICNIGFSEIMPSVDTPIKGLYITDSTQLYPEDRTLSGAVRQGRYVASVINTFEIK